ncbi:MAG: hypothetical protein U0931_27685 [Vulcanimicrobiota bacterium]
MRRGNSLLTTLVWIALIVVLAFGLAGLTVSHLSTVNHQTNRQQAKNLARSVVSTAIARIMADTDFGKSGKPSGLLSVREDQGVGYLSFESGPASDVDIPYSTNNLEQTTSTAGAQGRTVPKNSVYLIGVGRVGGVTQRVEAILAVPAFPYAIAAAGTVEARGGLTIGGLQRLPEAAIPDSGTFLPADLLANASGGQSIFLGQDTNISGDVRSAGQVVLDPNAPSNSIHIKGQIKSNAAPEKIPTVDLAHYDPQINGSQFSPLEQASYGNGQTRLSGIHRREGDLSVLQGLHLDGGTLYVHGDLNIQGGLSGKGILVVDGNVTIAGQSDFNSSNGVAVLASHDFSISGSDAEGSYFQGMVYTEGGFSADKVTVVGSLVAAGEARPVKLRDSRVFEVRNQPTPAATPPPPPPTPVGDIPSPVFQTTNTSLLLIDFKLTGNSSMAQLTVSGGANGSDLTLSFVPANIAQFYGSDQSLYDYGRANNIPDLNITGLIQQIEAYLINNGYSTNPSSGPVTNGNDAAVISLMDPSNFLKLNERIRISMWKEE